MNAQMDEGTPVRDHVLNMMAHLNKLEVFGADINEKTHIDIILMILRFEQFHLNYNMNKMMYNLAELLNGILDN